MQDKEFVMSCRQLCVAVSCAIAAFGAKADKVFEGLTEVSDVSVLNNADGNVVLGRGTLKYTGSSGTVSKNIVLQPSGGNTDTTIDVVDANTVLTVSGNMTQPSDGHFLKKGAGTLRLSGTDSGQRLGCGSGNINTDGDGTVAWDENGYATVGIFPFVLAEGRILVDGNGSQVDIGNSEWSDANIGGMPRGTAASATFEVANGAFARFHHGWAALWGHGTEEAPQDATLYVHDGGTARFEGRLRLLNFAEGTGTGRILIDNGLLDVNMLLYHDNCGGAETSIILTNNASLILRLSDDNGLEEVCNARMTMDVTHSSTAQMSRLAIDNAATVRVRNGSVLKSDYSRLAEFNAGWPRGNYFFDGGTWGSWTTVISEWGGLSENLTVGAGGMVLHTDGIAYLSAVPRAASGAEASASLSKTGSGSVAFRAGTALPLNVADGFASFTECATLPYAPQNVTVQSGAGLVAAGEGVLSGKTVSLTDGAKVAFSAKGARNDSGHWAFNNGARRLTDGTADPCCMEGNWSHGSAWVAQRLRVDRSFTLAFETAGTCGQTARGSLFAVFHNSPDGTSAIGENFSAVGLDKNIKNGFAIGVILHDMRFSWGSSTGDDSTIKWKETDYNLDLGFSNAEMLGTHEGPTSWRVAYDCGAHTLTLRIRTAGGKETSYVRGNVDLASLCGGNEAYFGFASAKWDQECFWGGQVANLRELGGEERGVVRTGGGLTAPAGAEVAVSLAQTEFANGFTAGSLSYGDGTALNVTAKNAHASASAPAYVAFDSLTGSGTLVKKGAGNLGFQRPPANAAANLRIEEGGLVLRKEPLEPLSAGPCGGWAFSKSGAQEYLPSTNLWSATTGFRLGSANTDGGANKEYWEYINSRSRVRVAGDWRMHFKAGTLDRDSGTRFYMVLHDNAKGVETHPSDISLREENSRDNNRFAMFWYFGEVWEGWKQRMNADGVPPEGQTPWLADADWGRRYDPVNFCTAIAENAGLVDVTIEHDAELKRVRCILEQGGNCVTNDFENMTVSPVNDDGCAYIHFNRDPEGKPARIEITDFSFEQLDSEDVFASAPYAAAVKIDVGAGTISLDSPVAGGIFKLAESLAVADGAIVRVSSYDKAATLDLGVPSCAGDTLSINADANSTVRIAALPNGVSKMLVDGGTFELPAGMNASNAKLELLNGAKIRTSGNIAIGRVSVNGALQSQGVYTAGNCAFVEGDGSVRIGRGMVMILR